MHILDAIRDEIGFFTIEEVSYMTNISSEVVRRLCFSGKLKANKDGKSWLITRQALNNYFSGLEVY